MAKLKLKRYSEELVNNLYKREYGNTNEDWAYFPKNEIVIDLINYSGEYEDKKTNKAVPYEWQKIKFINYSIEFRNWQTVRKQKIIRNDVYWDYSVDDKKEIWMTLEQFEDFKEAIRLKDNENWID
jgi:hypothetical protein